MPERKYIVGWLTCRAGRRDALLAAFAPYARRCLAEEGCLFFEVGPSLHNPDVVVVTEGFMSAEAHAAHLAGDSFARFWRDLPTYCRSGRFDNVFSDRIEPDAVTFGP